MDTDIFYIRNDGRLYHVQLIRPTTRECRLTDIQTGDSHKRSTWDLLWRTAASQEFTMIPEDEQFVLGARYGSEFDR